MISQPRIAVLGLSQPYVFMCLDDLLRYCRNVRPTWVKFDSKDTKESGWVFEVLSTKSKKRT